MLYFVVKKISNLMIINVSYTLCITIFQDSFKLPISFV
ncbi:Uncharacterised protein [Capnocytophaga ochracea]|uniref:Uncharacterized protein n=1 Tax=Capnocytophaga ochracea TaxID=1018 RepID=A0A2X2RLQ5_CAPOC|nr:Uncharacterised protein [Capnocytophaga ochracea]